MMKPSRIDANRTRLYEGSRCHSRIRRRYVRGKRYLECSSFGPAKLLRSLSHAYRTFRIGISHRHLSPTKREEGQFRGESTRWSTGSMVLHQVVSVVSFGKVPSRKLVSRRNNSRRECSQGRRILGTGSRDVKTWLRGSSGGRTDLVLYDDPLRITRRLYPLYLL
jgi:hypothetical protein